MNHIHLAIMPGGLFPHIKILGITCTCKLGKDMQGGVVFMVPPIDATLPPPVSPVHGTIIALFTDGAAITFKLVICPGIVLSHSFASGRSNKSPFPGINGLCRVRNRNKLLVRCLGQRRSVSRQVKPYLPAAALALSKPVQIVFEQVIVLVPGTHMCKSPFFKLWKQTQT